MKFQEFIYKHDSVIINTGRNLFLLTVALILLDAMKFTYVRKLINLDILFIIGIIFALVSFLLWFRKKNEKEQKKFERILRYTFLILVFLSIVSSSTFSWTQFVAEQIHTLNLKLFILTFILGLVLFYINRSIFNDIEIKEEENKDQERVRRFDDNFRAISKIPVLKSIVRWMHKEGWGYSLALILIVLSGLILRVTVMNIHPLSIDEYNHANAAKRLIEEGTFNYSPGAIITYMEYLSFSIFGLSMQSARLPLVIISLFSIILMYFVGKATNKKIGLLSAFLFAVSPWSLGMSTYVRSYELAIFLLLLWVYATQTLFSSSNRKTLVFSGILLILFVVFVTLVSNMNIEIDLQLFNMIVPTVGAFIFFSLLIEYRKIINLWKVHITDKYLRKSHVLKKILLIVFFIVILFIILRVYKEYNSTVLINIENFAPGKNLWALDLYFNSNHKFVHHWFNWDLENINYTPLILFLVICPLFLFKAKNLYKISLSFFTLMALFFLFYAHLPGERYVYMLFPFYVINMAAATYAFYRYIETKSRNWSKVFIIIVVLLAVFNTARIIHNEPQNRFSNLNGVHYPDILPVLHYLKNENINRNITLITTHPKTFIFYLDYQFIPRDDVSTYLKVFPQEEQINYYDWVYNVYTSTNYKDINLISSIIEDNKKGYIMIETWYLERPDIEIPNELRQKKNFLLNRIRVDYIGKIGSFEVYEWNY